MCLLYVFPTYIALYRLLININQHKAFSASSVKALRTIKYCTFTIVLFLALGIAASIIMFTDKEDITGITIRHNRLRCIYIFRVARKPLPSVRGTGYWFAIRHGFQQPLKQNKLALTTFNC